MTAFEKEQCGARVRIALPARVDVTNARAFVDAIQAEIDAGHVHVVLDFAETEAIDSTALGALIQTYKVIHQQAGEIRLTRVGDGVRRVLAITRIDRVFSIFDTLEEAVGQTPMASSS